MRSAVLLGVLVAGLIGVLPVVLLALSPYNVPGLHGTAVSVLLAAIFLVPIGLMLGWCAAINWHRARRPWSRWEARSEPRPRQAAPVVGLIGGAVAGNVVLLVVSRFKTATVFDATFLPLLLAVLGAGGGIVYRWFRWRQA
ncbi:MAG: hypothetical protein KY476_23935 [Planctomycetes bacterium]|nr:hypothetical protein [Planctomycetota bacterium]